MGKFVAYKNADDKKADEIDTSSNAAYYKKILQDALSGQFNASTNTNNPTLIGSIKLNNQIPNEEAAKRLIANEEGKYYYKWERNGAGVKDSAGKDVLNKLERVDVQRYTTALIDTTVKDEIDNQNTTINNLKSLPLEFQKLSNDSLTVRVNRGEIALYLDTGYDTQNYKYKLDAQGQYYEAVDTWIPKSINQDPDLTETGQYEYYKTLKNSAGGGKLRYLYCLFLVCKALGRTNQIKTTFKATVANAEKLLNTFLEQKVSDDTMKKAAYTAAKDAAKIIPASYRCFYSSNTNGEIDGFLTNVSISAEGRRSSGYEGRADKIDEVDYRWEIVPKPDTYEFYLAKLLSYIIGLDRSKFISNGKIDAEYHETNFPYKNTTSSSNALFRYYKKFLTNAARRNNPPGIPGVPRTGMQRPGKGENMGLRKWKKGPLLQGEPLGRGDKSTRENAGPVLANALKKFNFYSEAIASNTAIKLSQLPATAFAEYVVEFDDTAKAQWKTDNNLNDQQVASVSTDQEWCHLYGHGDGGQEILENFVSGSKHCNTEQLAIETGQRRVSQNEGISQDTRKLLTWRITADQILNNGTFVSKLDKNIVDQVLKPLNRLDDAEKQKQKSRFFNGTDSKPSLKETDVLRDGLDELAKDINSAKKAYRADQTNSSVKTKLEALLGFQREFLSNCFLYYPLGHHIHYKIFFDGEKCFEHHLALPEFPW